MFSPQGSSLYSGISFPGKWKVKFVKRILQNFVTMWPILFATKLHQHKHLLSHKVDYKIVLGQSCRGVMLLPGCDGSITLPLCSIVQPWLTVETRELDANINTKHSIISCVVWCMVTWQHNHTALWTSSELDIIIRPECLHCIKSCHIFNQILFLDCVLCVFYHSDNHFIQHSPNPSWNKSEHWC